MLSLCWHAKMKYDATSIVGEDKYFISWAWVRERMEEYENSVMFETSQKPFGRSSFFCYPATSSFVLKEWVHLS